MRWGAWSVLGVVACGPVISADDGDDDTGDTSSGETTATSASATATDPATTDPATTDPATTDPATTDPATTDPSTSITITTTDPVTTDPTTAEVTTDPTGGGLPDGSTCEFGEDCASGECYVIDLLGGICGQCDEDSDCDGGGCTLPNPLASPPTPSVCNDGSYGDGCESDFVCADELQCAQVVEIPGIVEIATCSECVSQRDCAMGSTCEPDIALAAFTGVKRCVGNGTLANGQTCDHVATGDIACGSGFCAAADIMGVLQVGVCSACEVDADCPSGSCTPPQVDIMTGVPTPGTCAP